jgi:hypothetical protein
MHVVSGGRYPLHGQGGGEERDVIDQEKVLGIAIIRLADEEISGLQAGRS